MFWTKFNELCVAKETSPSVVCRELGLSNATATRWKQGAEPHDTTLKRIADYFNVTVDYLLEKEKAAPTREERLNKIKGLFSQLTEEEKADFLLMMMREKK